LQPNAAELRRIEPSDLCSCKALVFVFKAAAEPIDVGGAAKD
jgi:hypothetical protein